MDIPSFQLSQHDHHGLPPSGALKNQLLGLWFNGDPGSGTFTSDGFDDGAAIFEETGNYFSFSIDFSGLVAGAPAGAGS